MDAFDLKQWKGFFPAGGAAEDFTIIDQVTIDSRLIHSPRSLFIPLKGEKDDGHRYLHEAAKAGAKFALVSKKCSSEDLPRELKLLHVPDPVQALQEIAHTYRLSLSAKIIAVTGSFGKTMVKDLLQALLSSQRRTGASPGSYNSQIGVPLSLLTLRQQDEVAIIEAAISEKGEMDRLATLLRPDYTLLAPIGKKHLATLQDLSTAIHEIFKLLQATSSAGWILLPQEKELEAQSARLPCPSFYWNAPDARLPQAALQGKASQSMYQITFPDGSIIEKGFTGGGAYYLNLLNMAVKAAWLLGISANDIAAALANYHAEPFRTEIWKSSFGAIFVNDAYCSDPYSVDRALVHFDYATEGNRKIFVFGGMRGTHPHHTDYQRIGQSLAKAHIKHLLLVGEEPLHPLINEMRSHSGETEILAFNDYPETFSYLKNHLQAQDLIIFKGEHKLPLDLLTKTFNDSVCNNQCLINLAAVRDNLAIIRKQLPKQTRVMVIVKALAYGTDDVRMAQFLAMCDVDILGVSYVDEGVALRRTGIQQSIFSINAAPYEAEKVVKWGLEVGVSDHALIEAVACAATLQNTRIKVHLHINTGMGRFGCRPEEAAALARLIASHPSLELEGLMTHFACADDPKEDPFTIEQAAVFDRVVAFLREEGFQPKWIHAANSSGTLRFHFPQYNMVRLGLAVYGLYVSESTSQALDLRLSLSLTSRIVGINICKQGETVSYGRSYKVLRETEKIAILPIGYFDGLHRNYSGKAHVLIHGHKAPMIGNICMDYMMVDVTDIPDAAVGDKVLIFGEDEQGHYLSPEELASCGDSIIHELITCLGPRIQRIFIYEECQQIR